MAYYLCLVLYDFALQVVTPAGHLPTPKLDPMYADSSERLRGDSRPPIPHLKMWSTISY